MNNFSYLIGFGQMIKQYEYDIPSQYFDEKENSFNKKQKADNLESEKNALLS